uniref:Breast cancer metastasis-suppressor 1-like protein n=1 Tax=Crassostrea virginica TaxID=6565 RepID=A0A8B8DTR6_CRAVI|nr:breast cancer metastasis-suppressor 1-like protein [Crassostrea virginica]
MMKMPVLENGKLETEEEEMEQETPGSNNSSDDDSEMGSEEEDGSDLDEEECERRKTECLDDMADLEKQFSDLKEVLYKERMGQVDLKLEEVRAGRALEYLNPLSQLQENMRMRTEVAGILREYRIDSIQNKFESEVLAAQQNLESDKELLYDSVKNELEEKIRRLEEDRHNIDISSDLWDETQTMSKSKKKIDGSSSERRKKPLSVSGPYIVYMLKDVEIIEDWTAIKKALKQKRKSEYDFC